MYRIGIVLALCACAANAQVYKWIDEKGITHYSNTAPQTSPQSKQLDIQNSYTEGTTPEAYAKPTQQPEPAQRNGPRVIEIGNEATSKECTTSGNGEGTVTRAPDVLQDYIWKNCHGMK